jgi:hypothetical protein
MQTPPCTNDPGEEDVEWVWIEVVVDHPPSSRVLPLVWKLWEHREWLYRAYLLYRNFPPLVLYERLAPVPVLLFGVGFFRMVSLPVRLLPTMVTV